MAATLQDALELVTLEHETSEYARTAATTHRVCAQLRERRQLLAQKQALRQRREAQLDQHRSTMWMQHVRDVALAERAARKRNAYIRAEFDRVRELVNAYALGYRRDPRAVRHAMDVDFAPMGNHVPPPELGMAQDAVEAQNLRRLEALDGQLREIRTRMQDRLAAHVREEQRMHGRAEKSAFESPADAASELRAATAAPNAGSRPATGDTPLRAAVAARPSEGAPSNLSRQPSQPHEPLAASGERRAPGPTESGGSDKFFAARGDALGIGLGSGSRPTVSLSSYTTALQSPSGVSVASDVLRPPVAPTATAPPMPTVGRADKVDAPVAAAAREGPARVEASAVPAAPELVKSGSLLSVSSHGSARQAVPSTAPSAKPSAAAEPDVVSMASSYESPPTSPPSERIIVPHAQAESIPAPTIAPALSSASIKSTTSTASNKSGVVDAAKIDAARATAPAQKPVDVPSATAPSAAVSGTKPPAAAPAVPEPGPTAPPAAAAPTKTPSLAIVGAGTPSQHESDDSDFDDVFGAPKESAKPAAAPAPKPVVTSRAPLSPKAFAALLRAVEDAVPEDAATLYRRPCDDDVHQSIVKMASSGQSLGVWDPDFVSHVVKEELAFFCADGAIVPAEFLDGNPITNEDISQNLSGDGVGYWLELVTHWQRLTIQGLVEPEDIASVFAPLILPEGMDTPVNVAVLSDLIVALATDPKARDTLKKDQKSSMVSAISDDEELSITMTEQSQLPSANPQPTPGAASAPRSNAPAARDDDVLEEELSESTLSNMSVDDRPATASSRDVSESKKPAPLERGKSMPAKLGASEPKPAPVVRRASGSAILSKHLRLDDSDSEPEGDDAFGGEIDKTGYHVSKSDDEFSF